MFAYHTPTRMKGSAIVQGFKSWASAIHPQLPLSRKESQRLLTALTSSFRRQLDNAHPPRGSSDARPHVDRPSDAVISAERSHGLHSSSAVLADRHLASVLTSPLLAQASAAKKPDVATVTAELQKNPTKDPIKMLEEYQERGLATIPIAVACLESFHESLKALSDERRKATITEKAAGKRTLLWVWKNKTYEDEGFIQDVRLSKLMIPLVVEEGLERYVWDWLNLDLSVVDSTNLPKDTPPLKARMYPYRWKGHVIRDLVNAKLCHQETFDDALNALFQALQLKQSELIPMVPTLSLLNREIRRHSQRTRKTKADLYDRFAELLRRRGSTSNKGIADWEYSWLLLLHPQRPSPLPALSLLRRTFGPSESSNESILRARFENPRNDAQMWRHFSFFVHATQQLESLGRTEDASWVRATAKKTYPQLADRFEDWVRRYNAENRDEKPKTQTTNVNDVASVKPEKIPMPVFAV